MEDRCTPLLLSCGGPVRPGGQELHGGTRGLQCQQVGGTGDLGRMSGCLRRGEDWGAGGVRRGWGLG